MAELTKTSGACFGKDVAAPLLGGSLIVQASACATHPSSDNLDLPEKACFMDSDSAANLVRGSLLGSSHLDDGDDAGNGMILKPAHIVADRLTLYELTEGAVRKFMGQRQT